MKLLVSYTPQDNTITLVRRASGMAAMIPTKLQAEARWIVRQTRLTCGVVEGEDLLALFETPVGYYRPLLRETEVVWATMKPLEVDLFVGEGQKRRTVTVEKREMADGKVALVFPRAEPGPRGPQLPDAGIPAISEAEPPSALIGTDAAEKH